MRKIIITMMTVILISLFAFFSLSEEMSQDITRECTITSKKSGVYKMLDGDIKEYWIARSGYSSLQIDIPENETVSGIMIEWFKPFEKFEVTEFGLDGSFLNEYDSEKYYAGYVSWLPLTRETKKVELKVYKEGKISEIHVYSEGVKNPEIQKWENPAEKSDIMLLVAHQDDEVLWFGGLLPYYGMVREKDVQVVYMTTNGRLRIQEALNCVWKTGVKHIPEIIGYKDSYETGKKAEEVWGGKTNIERSLVMRIRKYRPEVIVTHDLKGEYGHPQHKLLAARIVSAVEAAADPNQYSDSAKLYGAWEVKKVYLHLSNTETIYMDWRTPSDALDGKTPLEVAEVAFLEHRSQLSRFNMDMGKQYDYTKFGLVFSTVGPDVLKNDFLENTQAAQ